METQSPVTIGTSMEVKFALNPYIDLILQWNGTLIWNRRSDGANFLVLNFPSIKEGQLGPWIQAVHWYNWMAQEENPAIMPGFHTFQAYYDILHGVYLESSRQGLITVELQSAAHLL